MSFRLKQLFSRQSNEAKDAAPKSEEEPKGPINTAAELEAASPLRARNWIGVDLDGTLAYFDSWKGFETIGAPIPGMKARVIEWLAQGYCVKIFTARASVPEGIEPVRRWLETNGFPPLEITCSKDFGMIELWDDRSIQVVRNTGSAVISPKWDAKPRVPFFISPRPGNRGTAPTSGDDETVEKK